MLLRAETTVQPLAGNCDSQPQRKIARPAKKIGAIKNLVIFKYIGTFTRVDCMLNYETFNPFKYIEMM